MTTPPGPPPKPGGSLWLAPVVFALASGVWLTDGAIESVFLTVELSVLAVQLVLFIRYLVRSYRWNVQLKAATRGGRP